MLCDQCDNSVDMNEKNSKYHCTEIKIPGLSSDYLLKHKLNLFYNIKIARYFSFKSLPSGIICLNSSTNKHLSIVSLRVQITIQSNLLFRDKLTYGMAI